MKKKIKLNLSDVQLGVLNETMIKTLDYFKLLDNREGFQYKNIMIGITLTDDTDVKMLHLTLYALNNDSINTVKEDL
jgi:hypothetical protein